MDSFSHPETVLLALLEDGPAHAYELIQRVRSMEVERWARVPESTLYAVLRRLEERGWIVGEREPGDRGRGRTRHRRTEAGEARLDQLLALGLEHPAPFYSDRLVAAVFATVRGGAEAVEGARASVEGAMRDLRKVLARGDLSEEARVILRFYRGLADLHRVALEELEVLAGKAADAPPSLPGGAGRS